MHARQRQGGGDGEQKKSAHHAGDERICVCAKQPVQTRQGGQHLS